MDLQTVLQSVVEPTEQKCGVFVINNEPAPMSREFLLKQIENEINAGFVFVASARKAYQLHRPAEGDGALQKALEAHRQLLSQVAGSPVAEVRALTHQLSELREAIEWLSETMVSHRG